MDAHIVGEGSPAADLHTAFSWRGFRYVVVRTAGAAHFSGKLEDIYARWSYVDAEEMAEVSFGGSGAELLRDIVAMVKRTQRSNMVSGLPTDCPTRCAQPRPRRPMRQKYEQVMTAVVWSVRQGEAWMAGGRDVDGSRGDAQPQHSIDPRPVLGDHRGCPGCRPALRRRLRARRRPMRE